jgi:DNA-binding response OmpR family regulator
MMIKHLFSVNIKQEMMMTILVIERDELSFYLTKALLKKSNAIAIRVHDWTETKEILKKFPVDMVMIDSCLPGNQDAIEITKKVKFFAPEVPVIIKSDASAPDVIIQSFYSGCDDYIQKPLSYKAFYPIIEKYSSMLSA